MPVPCLEPRESSDLPNCKVTPSLWQCVRAAIRNSHGRAVVGQYLTWASLSTPEFSWLHYQAVDNLDM